MILSEKLLNQYKHLLAFDLSSYGTGLSLINQFVDNDGCIDFELSPCGTTAQLILLTRDAMVMQVIKEKALVYFKSQIIDLKTIENVDSRLLPCYLSQNKTVLKKKLFVFEGTYVASGLQLMQNLLGQGAEPVDFRIVRTAPKNVIVTVTSDSSLEVATAEQLLFKVCIIDDVQPSLKNYFQI